MFNNREEKMNTANVSNSLGTGGNVAAPSSIATGGAKPAASESSIAPSVYDAAASSALTGDNLATPSSLRETQEEAPQEVSLTRKDVDGYWDAQAAVDNVNDI